MMQNGRFNSRAFLAFAHDVTAAGAAWLLAYILYWNFRLPQPPYVDVMMRTLAWVVPLHALVFWRLGLYRGVWRYASLPDLKRIVLAVGVALLLVMLVLVMFKVYALVPRSVLVMHPILLVGLMAGSRLVYRGWREHSLLGPRNLQREPVVILGAGDAAAGLVRELVISKEWRVVGMLDDNINKHGRCIHGARVLGNLADLPNVAQQYSLTHAIIAMPSTSHEVRRRAAQLCADAKLEALTVPAFDDLVSGRIKLSQIRTVELDDLLGRDPIVLDNEGLQAFLHGKVVMVTGAGGSIGSELCRQIAVYTPALLILYELNEFALYNLEQELIERWPGQRLLPLVGDVKDAQRVDWILSKHKPSVIFHAAAYKHVPLMEGANAWPALRNNVLGTSVIGRAANRHGVEKFVLISTDKAVEPSNIMGASKRLAEKTCQALQREGKTRFITVRFGNVLGSAGSVIPKFQRQIAKGGPVTVTHPDVERYFMSIQEASQLVLQAGMMGQGADLFVLDMGRPVRILDLVRDMVRLSGLTETDIHVEFTGLRPGEKLQEDLLSPDEVGMPTSHPKLRVVTQPLDWDANWLAALECWLGAGSPLGDEVELAKEVSQWLPEFRHARIVAQDNSSPQLKDDVRKKAWMQGQD